MYNFAGTVEFPNSGALLSPYVTFLNTFGYNGFAVGAFVSYGTNGIAIDGSGDVWMTSTDNKVGELVGIATPVVAPISSGVKNNALGARP